MTYVSPHIQPAHMFAHGSIVDLTEHVSGIYAITGERGVYVGQSVDIAERIRQHTVALRTGRHHSVDLQTYFDHYTAIPLYAVVLEKVATGAALVERENYWLTHFDSVLLNSRRSGNRVTDDTRQRLSASRKGMYFSDKHRANISAAHARRDRTSYANSGVKLQYVLSNGLTFTSTADFADYCGCTMARIRQMARQGMSPDAMVERKRTRTRQGK